MLTRIEAQDYFAERMRHQRAKVRALICPTCGGQGKVVRERAGNPPAGIEVCGQCRGTGDAAGRGADGGEGDGQSLPGL